MSDQEWVACTVELRKKGCAKPPRSQGLINSGAGRSRTVCMASECGGSECEGIHNTNFFGAVQASFQPFWKRFTSKGSKTFVEGTDLMELCSPHVSEGVASVYLSLSNITRKTPVQGQRDGRSIKKYRFMQQVRPGSRPKKLVVTSFKLKIEPQGRFNGRAKARG